MILDFKIREILNLLKTELSSNVESETIEFKGYRDERALHNSKELTEELSALANAEGGLVIVGVRDESGISGVDQLSGIEVVDELQTKERLQGRLRPNIEVNVRNIEFENKNYVVIKISKRRDTLVTTSSGKACIREGRSSRPMSPLEIESAVKSLSSYDWTAEELDIDSLSSLNLQAVESANTDFCTRRDISTPLDNASFLEAIGATKNGRLTKGGLIFLGKPGLIHKIAGEFEFRFSWKRSSGELLINDVWSDCIWNSLLRAKENFNKCNSTHEFKYKDQKFSCPLLDSVAFHEAYLNAIVHRDYSVDGMISVNFCEGKIVITSPGTFYGGITAENIAKHEPRHRNKALARILMTYSLVDRAGMGVLRMGLGALRYGRSLPRFRETSDSVEVSMDAEFFKTPIVVRALDNIEDYGLPELLILNYIHETGFVAVEEIESKLERIAESPWHSVTKAVNKMKEVELSANNSGVVVRVVSPWKAFFNVSRLFRPSNNSLKHIALYSYLKKHKDASNSDIREVVGHAYASQTSKFLKDAKYVARKGSGTSARWHLSRGT